MPDGLTPLSASEKERLDELEETVDRGLRSFHRAGPALLEIRENRLYREAHQTFDGYVRDRWDIARRTAHQYMSSAATFSTCLAGSRTD